MVALSVTFWRRVLKVAEALAAAVAVAAALITQVLAGVGVAEEVGRAVVDRLDDVGAGRQCLPAGRRPCWRRRRETLTVTGVPMTVVPLRMVKVSVPSFDRAGGAGDRGVERHILHRRC